MRGRFNSLQETMLEWNNLYPYSAVHVVQLPGRFRETHLRSVLVKALEAQGLARLELNRANGTYQYLAGCAHCEIRTLAEAPDPRRALCDEMERQLNLPFEMTGTFCPFRFFVLPLDNSFFLGLTYFHPAADAESVVLLLKALAEACAGDNNTQPGRLLNLYPSPRWLQLRRHPGVLATKLASLPAQLHHLRRSCRPRYGDLRDMRVGLTCVSLASERLRALLATAKSWEVTLNDLFLALLLKTLSPLAASRFAARRRRQLSVGCIVNLRRELGVDSARTFGLLLGSFTVTHAVPDGLSLRTLAGEVRQQTQTIKRRRLYLGTPLELGLARFLQRFCSPEQRRKFYQKHHPLWGGITNMNLNSLWPTAEDGTPLDYFRAVSTGPATPLVLSVTTVRDHINLGLSYRLAAFTPEDVEGLTSRLLSEVAQLKEAA